MQKNSKRNNNILAKVSAIVIAVVLWFFVMNDQNPPTENSFTVPLEVRNLHTGLVVSDAPESVKLKIKGSRILLGTMNKQELRAFIDLKDAGAGAVTAKVNVILPSNYELVSVSPEKLSVTVENTVMRQMPVETRLSGKVSPAVAVGKVVVQPERVSVEGLEKNIEMVHKVVAWIDLSDKNSNFSTEVVPIPLNADGKVVENVTVMPQKIHCEVLLAAGLDAKALEIKPTIAGNLPSGIFLKSVAITPGKIDVQGDKQTLDKIDYIYTMPIDFTKVNESTSLDVELQLPNGVFLDQQKVKVSIFVESK